MAGKVVLAYGDSLTWGADPADRTRRHARADRWPVALEAGLGGQAEIVAEGLNGRTTAFDDYTADCDRNGVRVLPTVLETHKPLDGVILFLGTNDMKPTLCGHALGAMHGMKRLVEIVRASGHRLGRMPEVLIVAPPPLCETAHTEFAAMFAGRIAQSRMLATFYSELAEQADCAFFDAATVARTSPLDGVHLDAETTRGLGKAMVPLVTAWLGL